MKKNKTFQVVIVRYLHPIQNNILINPVQDKITLRECDSREQALTCARQYITEPNEQAHVVEITREC